MFVDTLVVGVSKQDCDSYAKEHRLKSFAGEWPGKETGTNYASTLEITQAGLFSADCGKVLSKVAPYVDACHE